MANVEVGNAYLQIIPSTKGIHKVVSNDLNGSMGNIGTSAGMKLGGAMTKAIAALGIGAVISKTIKSGLDEGAKLEQSIGGVEAIFDKSADKIKKYAADSWQSVGISANEYMENVTSFSAALINSMGKDTDAAAEVANQALIDMGDNANRFGTDMASIQAAYQGFAKQNYTMLDNLKLGYGGTKTEMERLLKEAQAISGIEYNIDNLGDVYSAIHVIQEELNVTGTTANEAASTLAGSASAMKAAWSDLLGNMAIGGDLSGPLQNLSVSIANYISNLVPMVANILTQLPGTIATVVTTLVPQLMQSGTEAMNSIASGFTTGIPNLIKNFTSGLNDFLGTFIKDLGGFIKAGGEIIKNIITGIFNAIPELITALPTIITTIVTGLAELLPQLIDIGISIIESIWTGIVNTVSWFKENWRSVLQSTVDEFRSVDWIGLGKTLIAKIVDGIKRLIKDIPTTLKTVGTNALTAFKNIDWYNVGHSVVTFIGNGIKALATNLPSILKNIGKSAWNAFKSIDWIGLGKAIINGIISGIKGLGSALFGAVKGLAKGALDAGKEFLGINSPSKVFARVVGQAIPEGIAVGVNRNADIAYNAVADMENSLVNGLTPNMVLTANGHMSTATPSTSGGNTINFYNTINGAEDPEAYGRRLVSAAMLELRTL